MVGLGRGTLEVNSYRDGLGTLPRLLAGRAPLVFALKAVPEDFVVDEEAAYPASGEGGHLFVRFEKRGLDTDEAVRRLARALDVDPRAAGVAGRKDRHAVTRQWASFFGAEAARAEGLELEGVRVLACVPHRHKLRTGHLRANRFEVRLRGAPAEALARVNEDLASLATVGVPNYYGEQRFGRDGQNLPAARAWLVEGGRGPRHPGERKLLVSVLQSELFNALCGARVREGWLASALDGDLVRKEDTGGLFVVGDLDEVRARAARFEVSATGPMFGASMRWPEREARAREEACLAASGLDAEKLARFARDGEGTRRPYRVRLTDPEARADADGLVLSFTLPAGAYATIVLRELAGASDEGAPSTPVAGPLADPAAAQDASQ